jgi:hypothetical protein
MGKLATHEINVRYTRISVLKWSLSDIWGSQGGKY